MSSATSIELNNTELEEVHELLQRDLPYDTIFMHHWIRDAKRLLLNIAANNMPTEMSAAPTAPIAQQPVSHPACPSCNGDVLYECVFCGSSNYPSAQKGVGIVPDPGGQCKSTDETWYCSSDVAEGIKKLLSAAPAQGLFTKMIAKHEGLAEELAASAHNFTKDDVRKAGGIVHGDGNVFFTNLCQLNSMLATAPAQQPLTDDAKKRIWLDATVGHVISRTAALDIIRDTEAAHGIKGASL